MPSVKTPKGFRERIAKEIKSLTLFDDAFMSTVFQKHPECTEYVLNTIIGKKLKVVEVTAQHTVKNLRGRSIRLDIKAKDAGGRLYNIEVQRENSGAKPRRARYNAALLDADCPNSGRYGEALPETYVIFITEKDYWQKGQAVYNIERKFTAGGREHLFDDGLHIIYVNGAYKGRDRLGDLMHDFSCADPCDMKSEVLRKSTAVYKDNEKEATEMGSTLDRLYKIAIKENTEAIAVEALKMNFSVEQIQRLTKLSKKRILELQKEMRVGA